MLTALSRRDFLKLGGLSLGSLAFTPSLSVFGPDSDNIYHPIEKIEQVQAGTELRLDTSPNTPLLRYAFDIATLASDPSITARPHVLQDRLRQLGHGQLATGRQWELASASPSLVNLLGLADHKLFGAPVSLSEQSSDTLAVSSHLLNLKAGEVAPQCDGLVVRFNRDFPAVVDLMPGDVLYSQSHELDGATRAGQMVVLAKSHSSQKGDHLALIMEQNGDNVSISWRDNQSLDQIKRTSPYIRFAAIRSSEAIREQRSMKFWSGKYPQNQLITTTLNYNDISSVTKSNFLAGLRCTTDQMAVELSQRNMYSRNQIDITFPALDPTITEWWIGKHPEESAVYGLRDLGFFLYIFKSHDTHYFQNPISPDWLYHFIEQQQTSNIPINEIITHPELAVVEPELILTKPANVEEFKIADIVFIKSEYDGSRPKVGIVTSVGPDPKLMFFDWNGTGIPREFDSKEMSELVQTNPDLVVLRTKYEHYREYVQAIIQPTKLAYDDLPVEITKSNPGQMIDFPSIPIFAKLQNDVINAPDLATRAEAIQQILARIGVETLDNAEYKNGTRWDSSVYRCSDYSIMAFHAIVKDGPKHLSKWVENNRPSVMKTTSKDLGSAAICKWLNEYGGQYGFEEVSSKDREYRIEKLASGSIMFFAEYVNSGGTWKGIGDTGLIYAMPGPNGEVIPVFTKATTNILGEYPFKRCWFDNPRSFFTDYGLESGIELSGSPGANIGILWSFDIPLKQVEPQYDRKL